MNNEPYDRRSLTIAGEIELACDHLRLAEKAARSMLGTVQRMASIARDLGEAIDAIREIEEAI